ncbi:recombinase family protein [Mycobacterium kiyosense]|uniref:Resolvase n=1 Tax=Mycobacterium kiyosense TaxID=2871094 RepID=A0A9P3V120_9MYCO|nr:recombinase family protein [Mycobacterium kiyosense]GLB83498.1 resolvase [Mycobacterium kiyosense]GLB99063.1 resolvase [Mycobacterium kiyosense]GLD33648.1 resolvase [Mycobacterium kiyosense]GLD37223.1 resolvase [Mycobacterium kiyosense]
MRLVGYLRVSTIEQADKGYGLDIQRAAIAKAAKALGATIAKWTADEGKSGALDAEDRPGLKQALLLVRSGQADGIIVRDLDRLARSVSVQEAVLSAVWRDKNTGVFTSVPPQEVLRDDPDDPMRTAMREMAGVFAGLERKLIAKRLRDGRKAHAANGGHVNGPAPFGWRTDPKSDDNPSGALVPVPAEQAALAVMRQLHAQAVPTREIADVLNAQGHATRKGGRWTHGTVARIISRSTAATQPAGTA